MSAAVFLIATLRLAAVVLAAVVGSRHLGLLEGLAAGLVVWGLMPTWDMSRRAP